MPADTQGARARLERFADWAENFMPVTKWQDVDLRSSDLRALLTAHAEAVERAERDAGYLRLAEVVATKCAVERNELVDKLAEADKALVAIFFKHGWATGHGDSLADLIAELEANIAEVVEQTKKDTADIAALKASLMLDRAKISPLQQTLGKAADQFAFYADEHAKKGTPEADAKAQTNHGWALMCARAAALTPEKLSSTLDHKS